MCASPLRLLRDGPPPPKVVLLSDALFFSRSIPVAPDSTDEDERRAQVTTQVELALEGMAPFPLNQLYYGYFWQEGSGHALAFAAYRRRFMAEQTAEWGGAELVLPAFATLLKGSFPPATTLVLSAPEGFTAVHWGAGAVPSRVQCRPVAAEATEEERAAARTELLRGFESKQVVDVAGPVAMEAGNLDGHFVARAGDVVSAFGAADSAALDVRDKEELLALRRARRRDVLLWRTAVACTAAFGLFLLGEIALVLGGLWQNTRNAEVRANAPTVERISSLGAIANRIHDLRTERLLPIEMISAVGYAPVKPDSIYFLQASASKDKLYTISFRAETANSAEIAVYRNTIESLPQVAPDGVDIHTDQTRNGSSQFRADVTFKAGAIKPAAAPPAT